MQSSEKSSVLSEAEVRQCDNLRQKAKWRTQVSDNQNKDE